MRKERTNKLLITTFVLYLTTVSLLCFIRGENIPDVSNTWLGLPADKVVHFCMFLPFIPLSFFSFRKKNSSLGKDRFFLIVLLLLGSATAYATEIIQARLGYRSYEIQDFISDLGGLAVGYIVINAVLILKTRTKTR